MILPLISVSFEAFIPKLFKDLVVFNDAVNGISCNSQSGWIKCPNAHGIAFLICRDINLDEAFGNQISFQK